MTSKDIRKYILINKIINAKLDDGELPARFTELAGIDFAVAFEVWEFMLQFFNEEVANPAVSVNLESKIFDVFVKVSETKTRQSLAASDPLIRLIYNSCATSCTGANLAFLTNLILSGKLETAEAALSAVRSNSTGDFGQRMLAVVDSVFRAYCETKGVVKCELTKKQSALLLDFCAKIKGPNKMLLTQRIKEL